MRDAKAKSRKKYCIAFKKKFREAAGAIRSTVNDLSYYVKPQKGLKHSAADSAINNMHLIQFNSGSANVDAIGLSWLYSIKHDIIIWHDGETGSVNSFLGWNKQKRQEWQF